MGAVECIPFPLFPLVNISQTDPLEDRNWVYFCFLVCSCGGCHTWPLVGTGHVWGRSTVKPTRRVEWERRGVQRCLVTCVRDAAFHSQGFLPSGRLSHRTGTWLMYYLSWDVPDSKTIPLAVGRQGRQFAPPWTLYNKKEPGRKHCCLWEHILIWKSSSW